MLTQLEFPLEQRGAAPDKTDKWEHTVLNKLSMVSYFNVLLNVFYQLTLSSFHFLIITGKLKYLKVFNKKCCTR